MTDYPLTHDPLESILVEGYAAAISQRPSTDCPYVPGTSEAIEWQLGHWAWQLEQAGGITFVTGDELKIKE